MTDDPGDLYFSFDEEDGGFEDSPYDAGSDPEPPTGGTAPKNRTFLIAVIALALISLIGIGILAAVFLLGDGLGNQVSDNELTNQANMTLFASTQTAEFENQIPPTQEFIPEEEDEGDPQAPEDEEEPTQVAQAETPTPLAPPPTSTGSSIIIQVTPLGGEETPDPGTDVEAGATMLPTLAPVATLPDTGLFDTGSYGGIAFLTLALIAVIVVARRLRIK